MQGSRCLIADFDGNTPSLEVVAVEVSARVEQTEVQK